MLKLTLDNACAINNRFTETANNKGDIMVHNIVKYSDCWGRCINCFNEPTVAQTWHGIIIVFQSALPEIKFS